MMLIEAILGGLAIGMGSLTYVSINTGSFATKVVGAICYGIILLAVQIYDLDLFVGRSGLLNHKNTDVIELLLIYVGNFIGVTWIALILQVAPRHIAQWKEVSKAILTQLDSYGWETTFLLAIFCGMMMYAGIIAYQESGIWEYFVAAMVITLLASWPFIHLIYFCLWMDGWEYWYLILPVTLGNILGANLWGLLRRHSRRFKHQLPQDESEEDVANRIHSFFTNDKKDGGNDDVHFHK